MNQWLPHDRNRHSDSSPLKGASWGINSSVAMVDDMAAIKVAKSDLRKVIHLKLKQLTQEDVAMQCV